MLGYVLLSLAIANPRWPLQQEIVKAFLKPQPSCRKSQISSSAGYCKHIIEALRAGDHEHLNENRCCCKLIRYKLVDRVHRVHEAMPDREKQLDEGRGDEQVLMQTDQVQACGSCSRSGARRASAARRIRWQRAPMSKSG